MVLTAVLSMFRYVTEIDDKDFVDRMHSYFTANLLIGLSILVSFKQFGGSPIECLVPDIFSGSWEQYAENYCWAQDTYYVPMPDVIENLNINDKRQRKISYYQWVPFFLLIEAACFRLPSLLWKYMSGHSGIKIQEVLKLSSDPNNIKPDIKKANIKSLTIHLQGALRFHKRLKTREILPHRMLIPFNLAYTASFVTCMYLLTKFAYLLNVWIQLLLMNHFLETDKYSLYGFGAIIDLLNGTTWEKSGVFPRVSLCDFDVRVMGNVQQHTIQCVLVINIFNEKIFVFLWFWYLCLLIFTLGSFLYWLLIAILPWPNRRFIGRHLEMSEMPFDPEENSESIKRFIDGYLRSDGIFVIRMLTLHSGVIFGTELVLSLWQSYYGIEEKLKRSTSFPDVRKWPEDTKMNLENADNTLRYRKALPSHHDLDKYDLTTRLIPPPPPDSRLINRILNATATSSSNTSGQNTALASPQHIGGSQNHDHDQYPPSYDRPPNLVPDVYHRDINIIRTPSGLAIAPMARQTPPPPSRSISEQKSPPRVVGRDAGNSLTYRRAY
uniref:Innexin n=1 Tax=Acrobeloides nanus TaxID=290746 RepID=A0A914DA81_9BILA